MIWAILRKDLALLRLYLLAAVILTIGCYLFAIAFMTFATAFREQTMQTVVNRTFLSLDGGSQLGFIATGFLGALLAGSAISLERSDRSVEFLACLPPTRWQNLTCKLIVVGTALLLMIGIHLTANVASHLLIPYVPSDNRPSIPDTTNVITFLCIIVSAAGGAWGFASCLKSNGAPILLGLGTPFLALALVAIAGWVLGIRSEGHSFQLRYNTGAIILGISLASIGSYLYLTRSEP